MALAEGCNNCHPDQRVSDTIPVLLPGRCQMSGNVHFTKLPKNLCLCFFDYFSLKNKMFKVFKYRINEVNVVHFLNLSDK